MHLKYSSKLNSDGEPDLADSAPAKVEEVLNSFSDVMALLMIDHYQKQISELELTLPQAQVLRVLRRGAMPTGQLASKLRISAPATGKGSEPRRLQPAAQTFCPSGAHRSGR